MRDAGYIATEPLSDISPEQARDARAAAWAYVFGCFSRRNGHEGGPGTSRAGSDNDFADTEEVSYVEQRPD